MHQHVHGLRLLLVVTVIAASAVVLGAQKKARKLPVPNAAAQKKALDLIHEVYGKDYQSAKTLAEKAELAKKLLAQATTAKDDPVGCYVLLQLARDTSTQAGNIEIALQAVDQMAGTFDVDVLKMKAECLQAASKAPGASSRSGDLARRALSLVSEAVAEDDYEMAESLGELARAAARRTRDYGLVKQIVARMKEVGESEKAHAEYLAALNRLEERPTDPEANLIAGRYLCLIKDDWEKGIPMLALSSDTALKALALEELAGATTPDAQVAVGDGWFDLAERQEEEANKALLKRAETWYRQAAPKLTRLLRMKIDKRLEAIEKTISEPPDSQRRTKKADFRAFQGHWVIKYDNRALRTYVIDAGGNVVFLEEGFRATLQRKGDDVLVDFRDGKLGRLRLIDGTLHVEHFSPATSYPHKVRHRGIGVRIR
ncbi:MAG: hypothetical protein ACYTG0_08145 [Planctomycetota bacterium]|jgi:hypothetical protein